MASLLQKEGFETVYQATTHRLDDLLSVDPDAMLGPKQRAWLQDPRVRLRTWDMDRFDDDMREATRLLWASEPGKLEAIVLEHPRNAMARRRAQRP